MTDHRPECPWPDKPCGPDHEPMHDREPMFCVACLTECICDRLRACEQRVDRAADEPMKDAYNDGYSLGYDAALDAAREAVVGLKKYVEFPGAPVNYIHPDFFIAAIDALRGDSDA